MSQDIVERVRRSLNDRNEVIKELYQNGELKKAVIGTLVKKGCPKSSAEDYFIDSIVNFVKSCYRNDFEIKSSLTNYMIGTAKNIWLKQVTNQQKLCTVKEEIQKTKGEDSYSISTLQNIVISSIMRSSTLTMSTKNSIPIKMQRHSETSCRG